MTTSTRNVLPALPSVSKVSALVRCACGCPELTARTYAPGHDARMKAILIRVVRDIIDLVWVEENLGENTAAAAERHLFSRPERLKAWKLTDEVAAWKAREDAKEAERVAAMEAAEVEQAS